MAQEKTTRQADKPVAQDRAKEPSGGKQTHERVDELQDKPETPEKAKRQSRKEKAALAAAMEAEAALSPQQRGMSPSWRRFYAAVSKEAGDEK